jgi:short-subunit dehydrogenase
VRELETNALGTFDLVRAIAPTMPEGSAIVTILSLLSLAPAPTMSGYSASKAASHSMVQALRPPLRKRGITVTGVYPGAIDTEMIADIDMTKASPRSVAEAALDGALAG